MRRYQPLVEALLLLAVTFPVAVGLGLPTLWFVAPLALITVARRPYPEYGLSWESPGSVGFHVVVLVAVFLPYALGHYALAHWRSGADFELRLPADFVRLVADQVLIVALPEEFFFRGYLQTECDRVWGKPYRLLGARCGIGLPFSAAIFACCHLTSGGPVRLSVFFPGLLYGWLRARTRTIAVPALYHAASNLLMQIMLASLA